MRLIDANALAIDAEKSFHDWPVIRGDIDRMINRQPTIDPESLRPKGWWECDCEPHCTCSNCKHWFHLFAKTNYCPNCGADMRGEGDE